MPRFPNIAEHAHSVSARVYSKLAQRARAKNAEVYPLHVGDTYRDPVPAARAEQQLSGEHPGLHQYAPVQGEPSAIDAFVDYVRARHGEAIDRELVQVMSGATAGLSIVCQVLLEPGDEVLLPSPFWPLSRGIIATKGAVPVQVPFYTRLDEPGFDPEAALEAAVTERTVALYVNTPNNPSGRVLSERHHRGHDARRETARPLAVLRRGLRRDVLRPGAARSDLEAPRGPRPRDCVSHAFEDLRLCRRANRIHAWAEERHGCGARDADLSHVLCAASDAVWRGRRAARRWRLGRREPCALPGRRLPGRRRARRFATRGRDVFVPRRERALLAPGAKDCSAFLERCADQGVLLTPGRSCGEDYARWVRLCFTSVPPARLEAALGKLAPLFRRPS